MPRVSHRTAQATGLLRLKGHFLSSRHSASPSDPEAQLLAALALGVAGWDDRSLERVERARYVAQGEDLSRVEEGESRLDDSPEAAREFLTGSLVPSAFRERLMTRP